MIIQQLSIFLENRSGRLTEVTETLQKKNINISALSIAETSEYGILRLIVSDPGAAVSYLKEEGFSVGLTDVLCLSMPNQPGALALALRLLSDAGLSVEYMYAFSINECAQAVIRIEKIREAIKVFSDNKIKLIQASELYSF
jgi:hypothetical protein